jgi:hypothetical protein
MKLKIFVSALALGMFVSSTAFALDAAAPDTAKPDVTAMKAKAQQCSNEADAKGLHGKERKKFRASCKKELAKKG